MSAAKNNEWRHLDMIVLTRQNGSLFALNDELIEIIEEHPDTTLKMTDGKVYIVSESMEEIIEKIIEFRKRYTN